jgi:hypothetical protein
MKNKLHLVISLFLFFGLVGCASNKIEVPNLSGVDESTAKEIVIKNQLVPIIEYQNSDVVKPGYVISTIPEEQTKLDKNEKMTLIISKGSVQKYSKKSFVYLEDSRDVANLGYVYIQNGQLFIQISAQFHKNYNLSNAQQLELKFGNAVEGKGRASLYENYQKEIPVKIEANDKNFNPIINETFEILLSLADLEVSEPPYLYIQIFFEEEYYDIYFTFDW